jgi:hypothetical protein
MLKTIMSGLSAAVPQLGIALKVGPYIVIALLAGFALLQHSELAASKAQTAYEAGQVMVAQQTCKQEAATQAAAEDAASTKAIQEAQAAANTAEAQLMSLRTTSASSQAAAATLLANTYTEIDQAAAKPGQDGPIPPVLAGEFP